MNYLRKAQYSVLRGMNSGRAPGLIGTDQMAYLKNWTIRGGRMRVRSRWVRRKTIYEGMPQGFQVFSQTGEMLVSVGGQIIRLDCRNWSMTPLTDNSTRNSSSGLYAYFCETDGSIVIQDGRSWPLVYDGSTFRRFTDEQGDTLPVGTCMAYGSGRLAVAIGNGRLVRIGDIKQNAHQSELEFTETARLLGGGDLAYPERVMALTHVPIVDTSSGKGPLLVGLARRLFSVRTDIPSRDAWANADGFETEVFNQHGITGHVAHAQVNQDVYFRAVDGLRSVRLTVGDYGSAGATPISREMALRFDRDTEWMLDGCSAAYFDNRLVMTHSPRLLENRRPIHAGVVSLNFDLLSEIGQKSQPAFDGEWSGVAVVQVGTGLVDGERRLFALCREGDANSIWEMLPDRTARIDVSRGIYAEDAPRAVAETPVYYGDDPNRLMNFDHARLWCKELRGYARVDVKFRMDGATAWTLLDTFRMQSATSTFENPQPTESRGPLTTRRASDAKDATRKTVANRGPGVQLRFEVCGQVQIERWEIAYELATDDHLSAENRTEDADLSSTECPIELPAEPTSPTLAPVLAVYNEAGDTAIGASADLGDIPALGSLLVTWQLANVGGQTLELGTITVSGARYSLYQGPVETSLEPGERTTIILRALSTGAQAGSVSIASNDTDTPEVITLTSEVGNEEQTCPEGYTGYPVAANTVYAATQAAANTAAEALLECVEDMFSIDINGAVHSLAIDSAGRLLLGGDFTELGGVSRYRLARLINVTPDELFNPSADGRVNAINVLADDSVIIGGSFTNVNSSSRSRIARLDSSGILDESFNPNASNVVFAVGHRTDGSVLVCGSFTSIGGGSQAWHAKISSETGVLDASYSPNVRSVTAGTRAIAIDGSGRAYIGGRFADIDFIGGTNFARITTAGEYDATCPVNTSGGASDIVSAIGRQSNGNIIIGGYFSSINGVSRTNIGRVTNAGVLDSFNPSSNNEIFVISVADDDSFYVGGRFTSIGGQTRTKLARFSADGSIDMSFNPVISGGTEEVFAIAVESSGRVWVGGNFTTVNGENRPSIARLNIDGTLA